jgi:hypothetical protein
MKPARWTGTHRVREQRATLGSPTTNAQAYQTAQEVCPIVPPPPPPRRKPVPSSHVEPASASPPSSASTISFQALSHSEGDTDDAPMYSAPSSEFATGDEQQSDGADSGDSWERERDAAWELEKERRLHDETWQAAMGLRNSSISRSDHNNTGSKEAVQSPRRRVPVKPPLPALHIARAKRAGVQKSKAEEAEELEGVMTVEARVERTWARWLCRSLVASPVPHWCNHKGTPRLPLPEDVKSGVLMTLILGQLLPVSELPPSLVILMTEGKGRGEERWLTGKSQGAGEKVTNAVRRIVNEARRVLHSKSSDGGKALPAVSLLVNGAPLAMMQVMGLCKGLALQRIQGDLERMMQWYQAAMLAVVFRMGEENQISVSESETLAQHLKFPKGIDKDALPAQMWAVLRTGLVFGCATFVYCEFVRAQSIKANKQFSVKVDLSKLCADPRLFEQMRTNVDYVFQCLDAAALPRIWTSLPFLTYPDDDHTFLLIQAHALYQTFANKVSLHRLEQSISASRMGTGEKVLRRGSDQREIWAWNTHAAAFRDIRRIVGQDGKGGVSKVHGTWRQPLKNTAFPVMMVHITAVDLAAGKQGLETTSQHTAPSRTSSPQDDALGEKPTLPRVTSIDLNRLVAGASCNREHDVIPRPTEVGDKTMEAAGMGTAAIARRVCQLEEMRSYTAPEKERALAQLEETAVILREEVSVLTMRVNKWKGIYEAMVQESVWGDCDALRSPPPSSSLDLAAIAGKMQNITSTLDLFQMKPLPSSMVAMDSGVQPHEDEEALRARRTCMPCMDALTAPGPEAQWSNPPYSPSLCSDRAGPTSATLEAHQMVRTNESTLHLSSDSTFADAVQVHPLRNEDGSNDSARKGFSTRNILDGIDEDVCPNTSGSEWPSSRAAGQGMLGGIKFREHDLHPGSPARSASFSSLEDDLAADAHDPNDTGLGHHMDDAGPAAAGRKMAAGSSNRDEKATGPLIHAESQTSHQDFYNSDPKWAPGSERECTRGEKLELVGASLNKAIETLTAFDNAAEDDELMMAVVLMHRLVSTPRTFLQKLISRFNTSHSSDYTHENDTDLDGDLVVMRHKVCSIILVWLRDFYRDFHDYGLVVILKAFLGMHRDVKDEQVYDISLLVADVQGQDLNWSSLVLVKDVMRRVLEDRLSILKMQHLYVEEQDRLSRVAKSDSTSPLIHTSSVASRGSRTSVTPHKAWYILDLDVNDVAKQLTLMESRLFFAISYQELMHISAILGEKHANVESKSNFQQWVPEKTALRRALDANERLSVWVSSTIVSEPEHARRVRLISFFIALADECYQICNFSTMMALWRGFQAEPVRRLVRANGEAMRNPQTLTLYAHLSQLCSNKAGGMAALVRLHDSQQDVPCVPLLDGFLVLLAKIYSMHGQDTFQGGLLNLRKARHLAQTVKQIIRHQHWRYDFQDIAHVEAYLSDLLVLDHQTLMARSHACES